MYGYIYETTCLINNKKYIGMHKWKGNSIDPINKFKSTHYSKSNDEWRAKLSASNRGKRWLNNGIVQKQVRPIDIEYYLNNGFVFGRIKNQP